MKGNARIMLTQAQLGATVDALTFVLAGEIDGNSFGYRRDTYERAVTYLSSLKSRVVTVSPDAIPVPVSRDDAMAFLENATRNWEGRLRLAEDDIADVARALETFLKRRAAA
ncbi:hypothetical protein [Sphingomonas sp. VDB2]|uniref:hypothetical protein n=1 Tax=Sphingomonas sp. VDB2 TaxID=3228751 RepID=UPI003A8095F3